MLKQSPLPACLLLLLSGCGRPTSVGPNHAGERYAGIGTFDAGRMWAEMKVSPGADPAAATLADDEHVIVVIDSRTGEVRQCGDHSGVCVTMNPWRGAAGTTPVALERHLADLAKNDQMEKRAAAR